MSKCLIFDADDTLWENNIYFLRAIEEFLELIAPLAPNRSEVLKALSAVEKELIPRGGYGSRNFLRALEETFRRFYAGSDGWAYLQGIGQIGERLRSHPMQLLPGVASILQSLRLKHRLMLFTKGDQEEQSNKIGRSGLQDYFDRLEIVEEKHTLAYQRLIQSHQLSPQHTFMIGNSPRSDVAPALAAGLWAVYVPHRHTWELEHEEVKPHPRLLVAASIQEIPALLASF
ncbi:MAG: HAD hydrolase-like protein [Acidobacteria bacterium]|nr:HAD hydrolase-like protein [Acidobacteriota bacterium]